MKVKRPTAAPLTIPCWTVKRRKLPRQMPKRKPPLPRPWKPMTFKQFTQGLFNRHSST